MDHRQARKTGWTLLGCGCVFIILTKLWVGLAMAARSSSLTSFSVSCSPVNSRVDWRRVRARVNSILKTPFQHLTLQVSYSMFFVLIP